MQQQHSRSTDDELLVLSLSSADSPEVEIFEGKLGLDDTGGLHSWSQHILLSGHVAWLDQSLQVIQVAEVKYNSFNNKH